jgi:hypothetical protein
LHVRAHSASPAILCLLASIGASFCAPMNLTFSTVKQGNPQSQFTSVAYWQ